MYKMTYRIVHNTLEELPTMYGIIQYHASTRVLVYEHRVSE